jgi:hypothetical protein
MGQPPCSRCIALAASTHPYGPLKYSLISAREGGLKPHGVRYPFAVDGVSIDPLDQLAGLHCFGTDGVLVAIHAREGRVFRRGVPSGCKTVRTVPYRESRPSGTTVAREARY